MRYLILATVLLLSTSVAATAERQAITPNSPSFLGPPRSDCPRTATHHHYAWDRTKPLKPRKLTDLPPPTAYMAVWRVINGCEIPLSVIDYRGRRNR